MVVVEKGISKKETERLILAAQDQAIRMNWIKRMIDKVDISPKCRMCGGADKTVSHIVSECKQLAQNEYKKRRHDKIGGILHWSICREYVFPHTEKSYEHSIDQDKKVLENEGVKLL